MDNATLTDNTEKITQKEGLSFNRKSSPAIQRLLDVISSIVALEYIAIAKQNPDVFLNNTPHLSELLECASSGLGDKK
ncbi:MAG: hypothetical protein ABH865_04470 [Candidatus Omnitrophota bacterium]|nr:hypothetical protein [Candidatus Omnitrophota bacterium]